MQAKPTITKGTGAHYFIQFNRDKTLDGYQADESQILTIYKAPVSTAKKPSARTIIINRCKIPFALEIKNKAIEYLNRGSLKICFSEIGQLYVHGDVGNIFFSNVKGYRTHIQSCRELRFHECSLGTVHIHGSVTEGLSIYKSTFDEIICEDPIVFKYIKDHYPHLPACCSMKNYRKLFK